MSKIYLEVTVKYRLVLLIIIFNIILFHRYGFADPMEAVTPTGFGISLGTWINPNFSGSVQVGSGGTTASLSSNLGLSAQTIVVPEFYYRWDHGQILDIRYNQYSQSSNQILAVPEMFQGLNYPAGISTTSKGSVNWGEISYELPLAYDRFPPKNYFLNGVFDLQYLQQTITLTNSLGTQSNYSLSAPLPLIGLHAKYRILNGTSLEGKFLASRLGFQDAIRWSYNLEAGINQTVFDNFTLTGKYRYFTFYNTDGSNNTFLIRFYGPEIDAGFHF